MVVQEGKVSRSVPFPLPVRGPARPLGHELGRALQPPIFVGRPHWGGHRGRLILMPAAKPLPLTIHSGHLLFLWGDRERQFAISIHRWRPGAEVEGTLRTIVLSASTAT